MHLTSVFNDHRRHSMMDGPRPVRVAHIDLCELYFEHANAKLNITQHKVQLAVANGNVVGFARIWS